MWACFFLCVCWFKMAAWSFHWCLFTAVRSTGFGTKLPGVWLQVPALSCVPRPWAAAFLHLLCLQQKAHHSTHLLSGCGDWIRIWVSSAWHSPEAGKCSIHISCIFITTWFHKFFFLTYQHLNLKPTKDTYLPISKKLAYRRWHQLNFAVKDFPMCY